METKQNHIENFALSEGGPFYEWLRKRGLNKNPMKLAIIGICITWLPLAIITGFEGTFFNITAMPFMHDVAMQARLLVALPILIMIRPFIDARVNVVLQYLTRSLLNSDESDAVLAKAFSWARRLTSSALTEIALLLVIIATTAGFVGGEVYSGLGTGTSWMTYGDGANQVLSFAGRWAVFFSIPVFQFFLLRWIWRYIVWVMMLFRISKAKMDLLPTHADRVCGLGVIALAQISFNMIFVAGSVILSGQFIAQLMLDPGSFNSIRGVVIGYIVLCIILIILPLLFFMSKILYTKNNGLVTLGNLGADLSRKFEKEWVNELPIEKVPTADPVNPSMIYDYAGMYDYLQEIRPVPITLRDIISMVIMLFVPFIPILFVHFSVAELVQKIAGMLFS